MDNFFFQKSLFFSQLTCSYFSGPFLSENCLFSCSFLLTKQVFCSLFLSFLNCVACNSDSRAFFKLLFLIFDVPNLCSSGACLIPLPTIFSPNSEFSALAPTPSPFFNRPVDVRALVTSFKMFPKRLLPYCVLHFLCLLSPICCVLVMVTFLGRFFLLNLLYLARKDCRLWCHTSS